MLPILIPDRGRRVNYTNPFNSRVWLSQLVSHPRHGLKFHPNLRLPAEVLGFTFSTNRHGLRGPENPSAPNVVTGTSFAMGLSVDDGANWYDLVLEPEAWFNGAMPVGPAQNTAVVDDLHRGAKDTLLFLYHPNVFKLGMGFAQAEEAGRDIFAQMGWTTDRASAFKQYLPWVGREIVKIGLGYSLYPKWRGHRFHLNAHYHLIDPVKASDWIDQQIAVLRDLFGRFRRTIVVRVPLKEECAAADFPSSRLPALVENYDVIWRRFLASIPAGTIAREVDRGLFSPDHFLAWDTHWNARGNALFARELGRILRDAGVEGVRA